jgi:hypothetical protein
MKGFTFYVAAGRYGGWRIRIDGPSLRITLGWVSICFLLYDLEVAIKLLLDRGLELEKALELVEKRRA